MERINLRVIPEESVSHDPKIKKQVMIRNGEIPLLTGFSRATFKPGQSCSEHQHDTMYEVYFVLEGEASLTVDGQKHRIVPNDCITIKPKEIHCVVNDGQRDLVWLYFGIAVD